MNGQAISKFAVHFPIEVFLVVIFQEQRFRMFSFQKTSRMRGLYVSYILMSLCCDPAGMMNPGKQLMEGWVDGLMEQPSASGPSTGQLCVVNPAWPGAVWCLML